MAGRGDGGSTGGSPSGDARPATVLVVDDDQGSRVLLRRWLEPDGRFTIVGECEDGEEAVASVAELQPDVVLLDIRMPGIDGRKALPSILAGAPSAMVVVVSALSAASEAPHMIGRGAFAFVEKADTGRELPDQLASLLADFRRALTGETVLAPSALGLSRPA